MLIVEAGSVDEVHRRLERDPWAQAGVLEVLSVEALAGAAARRRVALVGTAPRTRASGPGQQGDPIRGRASGTARSWRRLSGRRPLVGSSALPCGNRLAGRLRLVVNDAPEPVRVSVRSVPEGASVERFVGRTGVLGEALETAETAGRAGSVLARALGVGRACLLKRWRRFESCRGTLLTCDDLGK